MPVKVRQNLTIIHPEILLIKHHLHFITFQPYEQEFEFPNILKNEEEDLNEKNLMEQMEEQRKMLEDMQKETDSGDKSKIFLQGSWF